MQEEVENRTVNLAITTTKLSFRSLYAAYMKYRHYRSERKTVKEQKKAQKSCDTRSYGTHRCSPFEFFKLSFSFFDGSKGSPFHRAPLYNPS